MVKCSHAADLSSACQFILGSISGGIGMPAIAPFVKIWIFHFGRMCWSCNEKVYREALNCSNGSTLGGHVQVTVLYLPTKFEAIRTSSLGPTVIFLFGRMCWS